MKMKWLVKAFAIFAFGMTVYGDPVRGDGMIPFLAITGKPTEAEVRAKVAVIQEQGIDSFLIYARSGLELEYMGEEWLKLNEWFCDEAEKRGMKVWLYDEYNWPSGTCKGRVPSENDDWRYAEYGVYRNPDGTYRWMTALAPGGWVNVCEPAAVARFIELTHEVYAKRLDRWFKNRTILGIFTDEPGHPTRVTFPEGRPLISFRKYSGLEEEYKTATGRALKDDVEKWLATKEGDVWSVYLDLMGKRFRASYFDQIRAWCDRHGILFTGHMISENDIYGSARCNGNPILCLRGESLPGMDEIGTAHDATPGARPAIEWVTYNVARQAILHRGNGGLVELYACGPANHVPATLRNLMWQCAFHGIDHYITCMDVMDERGLVEKHGYLSPTGPIHPWYEKHARVLADEARVAAAWARKAVAEREVAVRYPNRLASQLAIAGRKGVTGPDLYGLLKTLELNQFTCRLVDEDESTDLPLVFTCDLGGTFSEARTGKKQLTAADALALCRDRLPATFKVLKQDGTSATDLLTRTYADGSSAVVNLQPFTDRALVAERNGARTPFTLPARGVALFGAAGRERPALPSTIHSLAPVNWDLTLSAPNLRRVNFDDARKGALTVAAPLKGVRLVTRDCAMSYAVTSSGRPIGINEQPAKGDKVIRHIAEPYAFEMDGAKVEAPEPCTSVRPCYDPLYRQTKPFDLAAGEHRFAIASGEADKNFFFPALFLAGDFAVFNGVLTSRPKGKVKLGPLAMHGLADFTGTATWSAEVTVPNAARTRLRLSTGGRVAQVTLDGKDLGARAWAPFEWDVPAELAGKKAKLEISVSTSVQPMFGDPANGAWDMRFWFAVSGPDGPCGLLAADWLEF